MKEKLCLLLKSKGVKAKLVVVTSLILAITVLGATYAFKSHENQLTNLLKAHKVSGKIIENGGSPGAQDGEAEFTLTPGSNVTKEVQFENTGDTAVFVRVAYAQTWCDQDGKLLVHNPSYATPNWTGDWTSDWRDGGDGWYYYNKILKAGDTTAKVLNSVGFLDTPTLPGEYATGEYELTFVMEIVQCSDEEEVNDDALSKTFGKTATVSGMSFKDGAVTGGTVIWD
jgi:hypothetical protein